VSSNTQVRQFKPRQRSRLNDLTKVQPQGRKLYVERFNEWMLFCAATCRILSAELSPSNSTAAVPASTASLVPPQYNRPSPQYDRPSAAEGRAESDSSGPPAASCAASVFCFFLSFPADLASRNLDASGSRSCRPAGADSVEPRCFNEDFPSEFLFQEWGPQSSRLSHTRDTVMQKTQRS
jgi:hypothetical protein